MRFFPRFLAVGALWVGSAGAAPEPAAAPQSCTRGAASALSELACELGRGLGERARGALVVGVEPSADAKVVVRPELRATGALSRHPRSFRERMARQARTRTRA